MDRGAAGRGDRRRADRAGRGGPPARSGGWSRWCWRPGPVAGAAVREWHHVRLFSRWGELVDPAAEKLLAPTGWPAPDPDAYPTGAEWAQQYLQPLADALGDRVRYGARVVGVARRGWDRVVDAGRGSRAADRARADATRGEERITARAVVDASGTWTQPNPLGGDGLPALGEDAAADRIALPGARPDRPGGPRPLRRQADRGRRQRALRADGAGRVRRARRAGARHPGRLAAAPRRDRQHLRRRRRRPAARPRRPGQRAARGRRRRAHHDGDRVPHRRRRRTEDGRLCWSRSTGAGSTRSTRSSR